MLTLMMAVSKFAEQTIQQYDLVHLIEQDGFADRYLAFDTESEHHVLLSILNEDLAKDPEFRDRYAKRARGLSRIRHPNIAAIYDAGNAAGGDFYIVSEQVEGFPLADRLNKLAEQESPAHIIYALTLIRQIASGLSFAERLGYFHNQLTPRQIYLRNVTLKAENTAVLVNLDIPPEVASTRSHEDDAYFENYLSPEQLDHRGIDGRSHVYSLGVILFQLLSGKLPSRAMPKWRRTFQAISGGETNLQYERNGLTGETYTLVAKSIQKKPANRYGSMQEFVDAVDKALAAEDLRIHTGNIDEPRKPRPIYVAPIVLLLICLALASAIWVIGPGDGDANLAGSAENHSTSMIATAKSPSPTPTLPLGGTAHSASPLPLKATKSLVVIPSETSSPTSIMEETMVDKPITHTPTQDILPTNTAEIPTETALPTVTPIPPTPLPAYRITVGSASLRLGPSTGFDVEGYLFEDDVVTIIGRNNNTDTWFVVRTTDGRTGWISASVGESEGATVLDLVPPAATIPAPPPTLTPTATRTPLPTDTPASPEESGSGGSDEGARPKPRSTPTPPL